MGGLGGGWDGRQGMDTCWGRRRGGDIIKIKRYLYNLFFLFPPSRSHLSHFQGPYFSRKDIFHKFYPTKHEKKNRKVFSSILNQP